MKSSRPSAVKPVIPPSITMVSPLMYRASSDARNSIVETSLFHGSHPSHGVCPKIIDEHLFPDKPFVHAALDETRARRHRG
jgi:hypothetical protein